MALTKITGEGVGTLSSSGATTATFNRTTSDGTIVDLQKDGTSVGEIGVADSGDRIYLAGGGLEGVGIDNGANAFVPTSEAGAFKDNHLSLGTSSARFENLYLSGGAYIGGTGSANYLQDYEQGTFTFTIGFSTADPTAGQSSYTGYYVKIGQLCTMYGVGSNINVTGGSGDIRIRGLPFTSLSDATTSNSSYQGTSGSARLSVHANCVSIIADMQDNVDYARLIEIISGLNNDVIDAANCTDGVTDISFTLTVPVA